MLTNIFLSDICISMENIGREIKELIKKEGVSVYKMAEDLGILNEAVYRSLSDEGNPRWKTVKQFLDYLGYDLRFVKRKEVKKTKVKPERTKKGR